MSFDTVVLSSRNDVIAQSSNPPNDGVQEYSAELPLRDPNQQQPYNNPDGVNVDDIPVPSTYADAANVCENVPHTVYQMKANDLPAGPSVSGTVFGDSSTAVVVLSKSTPAILMPYAPAVYCGQPSSCEFDPCMRPNCYRIDRATGRGVYDAGARTLGRTSRLGPSLG